MDKFLIGVLVTICIIAIVFLIWAMLKCPNERNKAKIDKFYDEMAKANLRLQCLKAALDVLKVIEVDNDFIPEILKPHSYFLGQSWIKIGNIYAELDKIPTRQLGKYLWTVEHARSSATKLSNLQGMLSKFPQNSLGQIYLEIEKIEEAIKLPDQQ